MATDVDVAVIGGGLAGIAAALAARAAGSSVRIFEAGDRLGGKAQTDGDLERGPQSFNGRHAVFWELLDALQLGSAVKPLPAVARYRYLARAGRLRPLSPSPFSLLLTRALTLAEKRDVLREALVPRPIDFASGTLHDFFASRFGESFASGPAAAMVSGIFAGDPRALSAEGCFPDLYAAATVQKSVVRGMLASARKPGGRRGFFTLEGGLGRIGRAAQAQLPHELSAPVRELTRDGSGFSIQSTAAWHARALVVATEAPAAAKLLWPLSPKLGAALGQLPYVPLSVVHWEGDARFPHGFGYLACPSERLFALGTMFHGKRFSSFVRGVDASDDQLRDGVAGDIRTLTGGSVGRVIRVDRHPHAVFQPTLEAVEVRRGIAPLAAELNLSLAGSYLGASAMRDALASGFQAGRRAHEDSQRMAA